jgi:SpoVK/Ycf46/Vps4 family AAA+-type ATPase
METGIQLFRWTRAGELSLPWSPFESAERLVFAPAVRERLLHHAETFLHGKDTYHGLKVVWRKGLFLYGPPGTGKSAASRAIARAIGWAHYTIPGHEILDEHLFECAIARALEKPNRVIVLEDVDAMVRSVEPSFFFRLLDLAFERADASFWIATTRRPEETPKMQLLRPGRFEDSIRMELPSAVARREYLTEVLMPKPDLPEAALTDDDLRLWGEKTENLSYAHLEEMRQVAVKLKLESREPETWTQLLSYCDDQLIAGDRDGGINDMIDELNERVRNVDPRLLLASLEMTSVFKRLIEKSIIDAAQPDNGSGDEPIG